MKTINIMNKVASEDFWSIEGSRTEYSHHIYRNSPFESCDSCGTCDGARCEDCRKIITPAYINFSASSDVLYGWLIEMNIPKDVAEELVFSDTCGSTYKGYYLAWPSETMLEVQYPELYKTITKLDEDILAVIKSYKGKFTCYGDLRDEVLKHYGLDEYTCHGHVYNQLQMYWLSCDCNHKVACN